MTSIDRDAAGRGSCSTRSLDRCTLRCCCGPPRPTRKLGASGLRGPGRNGGSVNEPGSCFNGAAPALLKASRFMLLWEGRKGGPGRNERRDKDTAKLCLKCGPSRPAQRLAGRELPRQPQARAAPWLKEQRAPGPNTDRSKQACGGLFS